MTAHLIRRLPAWVRTQPLDCMFAILGIPSGLVSLLGVARSRALDQLLPVWAVRLWAVCLLGLQLLSVATLVYFVAIIVIGGWGGVLVAWPLLVVSAATWVRRADLVDRQRRRR